MASLTLKNLSDKLLDELRTAAERDRRSLTQEIIHLLETALRERPQEASRPDVKVQVAASRKLRGQVGVGRRRRDGGSEPPQSAHAWPRGRSVKETLQVLGLDAASAQIFGEAKALLEKRGERLADADLLIGAIAAARKATVVTGNRKHYARVPGVTLEDWLRG